MDFDDRLIAKRKTGGLLKWVAGFFILAVVTGAYAVRHYGETPGPLTEATTMVYIPPRSSFHTIERILGETGVVAPDVRFRWLAMARGEAQRLRAGEYRFRAGQTPGQVLDDLVAGKVVRRKVTIPEGANIAQVAGIVAAEQLVDAQRFVKLAKSWQTAEQFGLEADTLEGYLFPDTYYFARGQEPTELVKAMVGRAQQVLAGLLEGAPADLQLTPHQVLTLASIVEKETALPAERPLIASVFRNRLNRGMLLQADPTVIYGIAQFDGNLTKADLKTATPYNTYVNKGLPPGPIANPGREAIAAVLNPAPEPYLYFVSRNDGSHHFSKTLAEHNQAVRKYQKRSAKKPGKQEKRGQARERP